MARGDHAGAAATDDGDDEFPLLQGNGLYASSISGDGNCLFHALSDQLYGHENNHSEIRAKVIEHMRNNASYFKLFLDAASLSKSSNTRPKRAKAAAAAAAAAPPSEAAIDQAFENHLKRMSQSGVYGDNLEICAFAREYDCDVKIYQREFAYVVSGGMDGGGGGGGGSSRSSPKMAHIAYHTWEHYSSIRNISGPHEGLPNVTPTPMTAEAKAEAEKRGKSTKGYALPWMVQNVLRSLPYHASEEEVIKYLEECKGDVNEAVGRMLDKDCEPAADEDPVEAGTSSGKEKGKETQSTQDAPSPPPPPPADPVPQTKGKNTKKGGKQQSQPKENKNPNTSSNAISETAVDTPPPPTDQPVPVRKPPKRESARERKERQKAAAAERKKGAHAGGKAVSATTTTITTNLDSGIKELYI
ncbi:hypothetical protein DFH27DRAFT_541991 [Peziza echinospora]|nr:hypothetical protein DFH27DRAFT_541991 [Peziza echinospora]